MRSLMLAVLLPFLVAGIGHAQERQSSYEKARQTGRDLFGAEDKPHGGTLFKKPFADLKIGDWGDMVYVLRILQKVSDNQALVVPVGKNSEPLLLCGLDMTRVADGKEFVLPKLVVIHRTASYTTALGVKKTVLVLDHDQKLIDDKLATTPPEKPTEAAKRSPEEAKRQVKKLADEAKKRLWVESPVKEDDASQAYPRLAGRWSNGEIGSKRRMHIITQKGQDFTATCSYQDPQHKEITWQLTGTVTKDGRISGRLTHTKAPKGYGAQTFIGVVSKDSNKITGVGITDGAASYEYAWQNIAAPKD